MKKLVALIVSIIMMLGLANVSFAVDDIAALLNLHEEGSPMLISSNTIKVKQNDEYVDFTDDVGRVVEPQIINDRTMVPFRKIFNSLGVKDSDINWNGETRTVTAKKDNIVIELQIENTTAKKTVDGAVTEIKLDSAPVIVDGRTLVPVRFIAESMNKKVGWDSTTRTVIIVDTTDLVEDLKTSLPKFVELTKLEAKTPEEFVMKTDVTGKLSYTDKKNKSNNSTLNITGDVDMKKAKDSFELDLDLKFSGKGALYNDLKEMNITGFDFDVILNNNKIYFKSSLLNDTLEGKWAVLEDDSISQVLELMNSNENITLEKAFEIQEADLNLYTYDSLKAAVEIIKLLLKDENIKITTKGSTTSYQISLDLKDILKSAGVDEKELGGLNASLVSSATLKDGMTDTSKCVFKLTYPQESEKIELELKANGKVTESSKVNIAIPSEAQTIDVNEI